MAALAAAGASTARANTVTYGLQFAPSGYTEYTGWGAGVTAVQATNPPAFFSGATSDNGVTFDLGTATLTVTAGNNYNIQNGIAPMTPTTNIGWLDTAFFFSSGSSNLVTATLSGLSANDSVDFQFISSYQESNTDQVTVKGNTTGSVSGTLNSFTALSGDPSGLGDAANFVDLGSLSGNTGYSISSVQPAGGEGDLSGAQITITSSVPEPATLGLMAVAGAAILLVRRSKTA
ncbi:MAG: PEP-CTERM sorting domain-containing protein [Phycisphaerae bacterium]|nr:PEP-CTERM sorting domain-containing protein [Phycisphaerae bacterium]